jgi:voltage-gated potassium channel
MSSRDERPPVGGVISPESAKRARRGFDSADEAVSGEQPGSRPAAPGPEIRAAPPGNRIERPMSKFLREPPSVRTAASVIVVATATVVVGGGVLMRLFDHSEYPSVGVGMWWALQTVTTVGYGDVTPAKWSGRLIAAFVMFEGIAFLAIVTAVITSTFVARAQRERGEVAGAETEKAWAEGRFDELDERLDRLESMLRDHAVTKDERGGPDDGPPDPKDSRSAGV